MFSAMPASCRNISSPRFDWGCFKGGMIVMEKKDWIESDQQVIIWQYRRDIAVDKICSELDSVIGRLDGLPFAFMTDLRQIRYILAEDKQVMDSVYEHVSRYPSLLEAVYLVDFRNYHRMRLLIHLNQFPNPDMVFKYEADARDYLMSMILKRQKTGSPMLKESTQAN